MSTELTTKQVAAFLEVDDGFVRRLRLSGRLHAKRQVGTTWLFSAAVVRRFKATWSRKPGDYDRTKARRTPHANRATV